MISNKWIAVVSMLVMIIVGLGYWAIESSNPLSVPFCYTTGNSMTVQVRNGGGNSVTINQFTMSNATFRHIASSVSTTISSGLLFVYTVPGNYTASQYDLTFRLSDGRDILMNVNCLSGVQK